MKELQKQNKAFQNVIDEMSEIAGYLWQRGWAERNAGNISVKMNDVFEQNLPEKSAGPLFPLPMAYPELAECIFLVSGTGKRMRDLSVKPMENALLIKLNENADGYRIISSKDDEVNLMPTSELPTHLGIHQMIAERGSSEKVILHTHVSELIAITQAKEFCRTEALNNLLWNMHPETIVFVPKGVGLVPYTVPGSVKIAEETIEALRDHDVALWEKHGIFAIGNSLAETFDLIDILAKSARIYFMCRSAGIHPEGFSDQQLEELRKLSANF